MLTELALAHREILFAFLEEAITTITSLQNSHRLGLDEYHGRRLNQDFTFFKERVLASVEREGSTESVHKLSHEFLRVVREIPIPFGDSLIQIVEVK
jgi:hypothetical protein